MEVSNSKINNLFCLFARRTPIVTSIISMLSFIFLKVRKEASLSFYLLHKKRKEAHSVVTFDLFLLKINFDVSIFSVAKSLEAMYMITIVKIAT